MSAHCGSGDGIDRGTTGCTALDPDPAGGTYQAGHAGTVEVYREFHARVTEEDLLETEYCYTAG